MSEASDAVDQALIVNKRLAASRLVRKQELEAQVVELKRERAGATGDQPDLDARIDALLGELVTVDAEYIASLDEIAELRRLARRAGEPAAAAAAIAATADRDPILESSEDRALADARRQIAELTARAALADELAARPRTAPLSREEADARARAELAELRAKRAAPSDGGEDPSPPLKKTL